VRRSVRKKLLLPTRVQPDQHSGTGVSSLSQEGVILSLTVLRESFIVTTLYDRRLALPPAVTLHRAAFAHSPLNNCGALYID
jgi:hypothetical protein